MLQPIVAFFARHVGVLATIALSICTAKKLAAVLSAMHDINNQPRLPLLVLAAAALSAALATLVAFLLTVLARGRETQNVVEGLGFRFQGSAALVVVWILATVALALAAKLLVVVPPIAPPSIQAPPSSPSAKP